MKRRIILTTLLSAALIVPTFAQAKGFSGGSHSSFSSSRSSSFSSRSSSPSRSVNLTKSPSTSTKSNSFSGGSSTKTSTTKSFSGGTSTKSSTYKSSGSFSGRTSTVTGRTYRSTPTRTYYNGHYVTVSHYYHVGYSPYSWFGYYHGFSSGMFWGSLYHPWGGTYLVGGQYASYGISPLAWIIDLFVLLILVGVVIAIIKTTRRNKTVFTRRF